jgi:eukaryotic-like serine/threonine-protein kinase
MPDLPTAIGRYVVDRELGRGAMGVVYKAHDPEIDRPVAIKLVRMDLLEGGRREDYLARFRREVQAAARCLHPNIVAIYDFGSHEGEPFFVMEYVEGRPLDETLPKDAGVGVEAAGAIVLQLLDALSGAHALGVVHRDIKPANLLLAEGGRIKVMDFGISRVSTSHLTQAGAVMGTPRYMSPEQIRGEAVDARSDVFSTGAVLHELLVGRTPFTGRSFEEVMVKLLYEEPDLAPPGPDMPAALREVVARAIAKPPDDRFESAAAMAAAIRAGLSGTSQPAPAASTTLQAAARADQRLADTVLLAAIERRLAQYMGPIAGRMVRNAARDAGDAETLCDRLAQNIDEPGERERFLKDVRARLQRTGDTLGSLNRPSPGAVLSEAEIEKVQQDLARYLGPIAKVLVRRAAASAASATALRQAVAQHLEQPAERSTFLSGR